MVEFDKFYQFCVDLDEVRYVPNLVFSQLEDNENNENTEVLNDIENLNGELVACWQFDTACTGDIENVGVNNGNYIERTTVRVYDDGDNGDNVLVSSKILSDFHRGSIVEIWEKQVAPKRIFEILEGLEEKQRELYSR